jgi:hypothetical protein
MLTSFSKIFEKIIFNRLQHHFDINNILAHEQYGFQTKLSTDSATHDLINNILSALNNKLVVGGSFTKWLDCCCSTGYKWWSMICCTEPGMTRPCVYCMYIICMTCKMGGEQKKQKKKLTMDNYCRQWLTRDRPDLSSERAPNKDNTAKFRQN